MPSFSPRGDMDCYMHLAHDYFVQMTVETVKSSREKVVNLGGVFLILPEKVVLSSKAASLHGRLPSIG